MEMKKFNFKELLESMENEINEFDFQELYKAILASCYGFTLEEIEDNPEIEDALNEAIHYCWTGPIIPRFVNFIDQDLLDFFRECLDNRNVNIDGLNE